MTPTRSLLMFATFCLTFALVMSLDAAFIG